MLQTMTQAPPVPVSSPSHTGATLTIDLAAVAENYRLLQDRVGPGVRCGAAVKADCYGLGARQIAPVLFEAGCRDFFVAHLDEGLALRAWLPAAASIMILNGLMPGCEANCANARLIPVLNSVEQVEAYVAEGRRRGQALRAFLQVDSGMSRFGLSPRDVERLASAPEQMAGLEIACVMSHLACADEPDHPANAQQLAMFRALAAHWPDAQRSFANSSGIFLGPDFHFNLTRPGAALYGINPTPYQANPMRPVARLVARVIQTRTIGPGDHVGYGFTYGVSKPTRLATLAVGYADGISRMLGNRGVVHLRGAACPIVGRVSMDCLTIDLSGLGDEAVAPGTEVEIIGAHQSVDAVAGTMGTIGYEVLTSLGSRFNRIYRSPSVGGTPRTTFGDRP